VRPATNSLQPQQWKLALRWDQVKRASAPWRKVLQRLGHQRKLIPWRFVQRKRLPPLCEYLCMGDTSGAAQRSVLHWAVVNSGIVGLALAVVWLVRSKSVVCAISSFTACPSADARLIPALVSSVVLVLLWFGALVAGYFVPAAQRSTVLSGVSLLLAVTGIIASLVVLFSAGFVALPVWG